jgi:L-lactate permease
MTRHTARMASSAAVLMAGVFYGAMFAASPTVGWPTAVCASLLVGTALGLAKLVALEDF